MRSKLLTFSPVLLLACTNSLAEATFPTGSQTTVGTADHLGVYVVDEDGGRIIRYSIEGGETASIEVGARPARVARVGGRVFATLRGERAVVELSDVGGELSVVRTVVVGAEPVGIVAREDGTKVYVALSQDNAVVELDGSTLAELRRWSAAGQPTWLALHPSGEALFVSSAVGGHLYQIKLEKSGTISEVEIDLPSGGGESGKDRLTRRFTGDPGISSDGRELSVPALYVDNLTPVDDPNDEDSGNSGYASSPSISVSRFNPALIVAQLDENGEPSGANNLFIAGFSPIKRFGELVRSYPTSATYAPGADFVVVTMESSASAIVLSTQAVDAGPDTGFNFDTGGGNVAMSLAGFRQAAGVYVSMDAGPRGAAFTSDSAVFVHNFVDRNLREIDLGDARSKLASRLGGDVNELGGQLVGGASHPVYDATLSETAEEGRRLFYTAVDSRVAVDGAGVSCSTCHFEGRNDGLTWTFSQGVRQTPSLAAAVAVTAPYTWTDEVSSIAAEAMVTSQGRMGGESLTATEAAEIEAYISSVPEIDHPDRGSTADAVIRGKIVFESEAVGCADCHPAPLYTDNESHDLYGLSGVNTPSLVGIAATAPYLHSGTVPTLRDVLETARTGQMGDTSRLTDAEFDDLESFLRSI